MRVKIKTKHNAINIPDIIDYLVNAYNVAEKHKTKHNAINNLKESPSVIIDIMFEFLEGVENLGITYKVKYYFNGKIKHYIIIDIVE